MKSFADLNEVIAACARAIDISALIIVEKYQGKPTAEALEKLAQKLAADDGVWCGVDARDLNAVLGGMLDGLPVENVVSTEIAIRAPFILAGHLLVLFQEPQEQWFDYLDRRWETIEDRP